MERVEQLEHAPLRVFAQLDAAAESLRGRIEDDQLDIALLAESIDAAGQLAEHAFVQQVVFGAVEREPRHFAFDVHFHELKIFELGRDQRQRSQNFDA